MFGLITKKKHDQELLTLNNKVELLTSQVRMLQDQVKGLNSVDVFKVASNCLDKLEKALPTKSNKVSEVVAKTKNTLPAGEVSIAKTKETKSLVTEDKKALPLTAHTNRLAVLEELLPDIKFSLKDSVIQTVFNGKPVNVKVREKRSNGSGWGVEKSDVGEILVLLDNGKLYGVAVVKRDWLTDRNSIWIPAEKARAIGIKMATNRVLRNFG